MLFHRLAFAGQGALIRTQPCRYREPQVGGHIIARLQQHHIAGNQVRCGHGDDRPFAAHLCVGRGQLLQRLQRFFGPVFLNHAQQSVEQYHQQDDARIHPFAQQHAGDQRRGQKHQHHYILKLRQIHLPEGPLLRLLQRVGAVLFQPRGSLGTGQAHGCLGAQRPRGFIDAFPVPIQTFHFLSGTGSLQAWRPSSFPNHSTKKRKENLFPLQSYPRGRPNIQFRASALS